MALSRGAKPNGAHTVNSSLSSAATIAIPSGATSVLLQALTQNVRITLDGTTPTSTVGFQLKAGDPAVELGIDLGTSLQAIEEAATAALQIQFLV